MSGQDIRTVDFEPRWSGVSGVFGGKVIAAVAEAARAVDETDGLDLASVHVEFTGGASTGTAELHPVLVHRGRSTATVQVECLQQQDGSLRRVVGSTAKFSASDPAATRLWSRAELPEGPGPDAVPEFDPPWGRLAYDPLFEVRLVQHTYEAGVPTTRAWVRARPGTGLGLHGTAAALLDVLPPGLFMHEPLPAFVPTVDFTMHLDATALLAEGEWGYGVMRTEWAGDGFCLETATLHRQDGRFVARGTQTRRVGR